jgi:hypothetical protein
VDNLRQRVAGRAESVETLTCSDGSTPCAALGKFPDIELEAIDFIAIKMRDLNLQKESLRTV